MALDVLINDVEATTSAGATSASTSDTAVTVSTILGTFPALTSGVTQCRVMDKAQLGVVGAEVMLLTANNGGATGAGWTVTRAAEGTISTHAAGWVMVPVLTSSGAVSANRQTVAPVAGQALMPLNSASGVNQTLVMTNGALWAVPVFIPPGSPPAAGVFIVTQNPAGSAGAVIRMGIYRSDGTNGLPNTLQVDAGAAAATSGNATITLSFTGQPLVGLVWVASVCQGAPTTSPTIFAYPNQAVTLMSLPFQSPQAAATFARPTAVSTGTSVTGALPVTFPSPILYDTTHGTVGAGQYPQTGVSF